MTPPTVTSSTTPPPRTSWSVALEFKPQDLWIGLFWRNERGRLDIWICLLPCWPIHITIGDAAPLVWFPFHIDGDPWTGLVDSVEKWRQVVVAYGIDVVLRAMQAVGDHSDGVPDFGFRSRHVYNNVEYWSENRGLNLRKLAR